LTPLAWIGRQRTRAIAALVLIGICVPPLGAVLKPYVTEAVFGVLCIAFLRTDIAALRSQMQRYGLLFAAVAWTTVGIPLLFALVCRSTGVDTENPALYQGLMLQAVTSPMMAAPAFAALMGLDATLVLLTLVAGSVLTPFSAPFFAAYFGLGLTLSPLTLGLKLFGILAGSAFLGLALRRIFGATAIARRHEEIDGLNIAILFVFIAAIMADVGTGLLADPLRILALSVLGFTVYFLILLITYTVFLRFGKRQALAIGMVTSQRNMGLMLAATGGAIPDLTWLYFAVGQLPIYLSPLLLQPFARRLQPGGGPPDRRRNQ